MTFAPIKLRGHHLLCLLPYVGHGYTPDFTQNFNGIAERLGQGAPVEIVAGMDDICTALHCGDNGDYKDAGHCLREKAVERDNLALQDVGAVLGLALVAGQKLDLTAERVEMMRQCFADGSLRKACHGCEWFDTCSGIAACGFDGVKLFPSKD